MHVSRHFRTVSNVNHTKSLEIATVSENLSKPDKKTADEP